MFKEFKAFVNQGNALDLAVGVLIGAAFGKIVNSIVTDIITPIISLALGGTDFNNLYIPLEGQPTGLALEEARKARRGHRLRRVPQQRRSSSSSSRSRFS